MRTSLGKPPRLPVSAIPDGCAAWNEEHARAWAGASVPWWVPVRPRKWSVEQAVMGAAIAAFCLLTLTDLPPYLIALLPLQAVWGLWRPEVVRFSAPALIAAVAVAMAVRVTTFSWPVVVWAALLLVVSVTATEFRARARARQRNSALAAADGGTAVLPDADGRVRRGRFLIGFGVVVCVPGLALLATSGLWPWASDRQATAASGLFVAGLGLTLLFSGILGRRRALALRRAPAPVLRVLVNKDWHGDAVVFAADDTAALRPLFTVPVSDLSDDNTADEDDDDDEDDEAELAELLDGPEDDGERGPLREAVLYGVPYDGAEVLLVSAAEKPGEKPVVEWSTGPVRPLAEGAARRRIAADERTAARAAAREEQHLDLVEAARATAQAQTPAPVRQWRAGGVDWLSSVLAAQWGLWIYWIAGDLSAWQLVVVFLGGVGGAVLLAEKLRWRITADRTGLWLNGLRRPTHVPWDDLRSARGEAFELKLRWRGDGAWSVGAPRWPWLQRRFGLTHPYDALAAELTALHTDPALRPTGDSNERDRGRPLWPLATLLATVWVAAMAVGQGWL
jgi:hypothetical protein